jgi:signal transduction histidine kinase
MLLLSDSLATRISAIILGSFAVLAVLVAALMLWPSPRETGQGLFDLPVPTETVAIVKALEASPPAARPLVIEHRPPEFARSYLARGAALAGVAALVLLAGLVIAVRQATRPVVSLAHAARRFSIDQTSPDLPVTGPRELRELSSAFNDMQSRIRDLVQDRTRVLAAVAHDLRTYLTRLRLRAEFIADEDQRARAERDIEEMSLLLDDTLTFAQQSAVGAADATCCDAGAEVRELVEQRWELGQPIRLIDGSSASTPGVACSRLSLQRMLGNLVDNAIRYGGQADICVKAADGSVEIEVRDHGPGIPAEALERVTEPFERLEASRARGTGGAGLGLAIVKGLAESAGGALLLDNAGDGGLRARLRFPIDASRVTALV